MTNNINRYSYRVSWSEEDGEYVSNCLEFSSLSWLDESPEQALSGIRAVVNDCIQDMTATGEPLPEPIATNSYTDR